MQNYLSFETDLGDDAMEDADGNLIEPAGRSILKRIQRGLEALGIESTTIEKYSFYGWQTYADFGENRMRTLLQGDAKWLIICESQSGVAAVDSEVEEYVDIIRRILNDDEDFSELTVGSEEDYRREIRSKHSVT